MFCEHLPWTILKYWKANLTEHPGETRENVIIFFLRFHLNTHYQLECLAIIKLFGVTFMPWISVHYITNSKELLMKVMLFCYKEFRFICSVNQCPVKEHTKLDNVFIIIAIWLWNMFIFWHSLASQTKKKQNVLVQHALKEIVGNNLNMVLK